MALKGLAILVVLAWSLIPIAMIMMSSFKTDRDIFAVPPRLAFQPTWMNYVALWERWGDFFHGLLNSLIVTAGATIVAVLSSAVAGYAYSRFRHKVLAGSAFFLIFIRLIPPIVITLPLFPAVNWLGLNDTHFILIILYATFFVSLGTLVMRTFIDQIPKEIDEAAVMDGRSRLGAFVFIIAPLAAPGIAATAVLCFILSWNEFLYAFILVAFEGRPLTVGIPGLVTPHGTLWGQVAAVAVVATLPILIFTFLVRRQLVRGLTFGAVKG